MAIVDFDPSKLHEARNITIWEYLTLLNTKLKMHSKMKSDVSPKHTN